MITQEVIYHISPAKQPVYDSPSDRMPVSIAYHHSQCRSKGYTCFSRFLYPVSLFRSLSLSVLLFDYLDLFISHEQRLLSFLMNTIIKSIYGVYYRPLFTFMLLTGAQRRRLLVRPGIVTLESYSPSAIMNCAVSGYAGIINLGSFLLLSVSILVIL